MPGFVTGWTPSGELVARPVPVPGPDGPWEPVRRQLAVRGSCLVYGVLDGWLPAERDPARLAPLLGGPDWERYRRMTNERAAERFLAARLLLKHAAATAVQADPRSLEIWYKLNGRPYVRGCDQVDVSLSHSGTMLVVGITQRGLIGVDVESKDRWMLVPGIEAQVCTPAEREAWAALPEDERNAELIRLWTLKEAYSKAIGQGLRFRFSEFGFGPGSRPVGGRLPDGSPGAGVEWSFGTFAVDGGYTISFALGDAGFGSLGDTAVATMLDPGLVAALAADLDPPEIPMSGS
ncbi:4'-phosphopantetheinyl transferase family protein [Kitasatospora sp. NPDC087314]|uniref:4'-phosphopantetheinyl transferase family protein n=1 Tax=Kitasatospora sp. NPDC087314 TaxID=3364068 RepID=UPI0037F2FEB1